MFALLCVPGSIHEKPSSVFLVSDSPPLVHRARELTPFTFYEKFNALLLFTNNVLIIKCVLKIFQCGFFVGLTDLFRFILCCNATFRPLEGRFVAMKVQCPFVLKNLQLLIIKHQKQHSNVYDLTFNHLFLPQQVISHH